MERSSELTSILAMSDIECAGFLTGFMSRLVPARGNGKTKTSSKLNVAMCKAIAALEHQALWIPFSSGNIPEDKEEVMITLKTKTDEILHKDLATFYTGKHIPDDYNEDCCYSVLDKSGNHLGYICTHVCWSEIDRAYILAWLPTPDEYNEPEESTDKEEK